MIACTDCNGYGVTRMLEHCSCPAGVKLRHEGGWASCCEVCERSRSCGVDCGSCSTEDHPAPGELGLEAHRELREMIQDDREGRR